MGSDKLFCLNCPGTAIPLFQPPHQLGLEAWATGGPAALWFFFFFFFLVRLGFELRAFCLQSRYCTTWAIPPVHFALFILEMGVFQTICLSWPLTVILLISASQVARIIGVSHWHLAAFWFLQSTIHCS
jgi:hypothetical protein